MEEQHPLVITNVEIRPHDGQDHEPMAFASIVLNGVFIVKDLRIIDGPKGVFVAMPARKSKTGKYNDTAHPLNQAFRDYLEETVLNAFDSHEAAGPAAIVPEATGLN